MAFALVEEQRGFPFVCASCQSEEAPLVDKGQGQSDSLIVDRLCECWRCATETAVLLGAVPLVAHEKVVAQRADAVAALASANGQLEEAWARLRVLEPSVQSQADRLDERTQELSAAKESLVALTERVRFLERLHEGAPVPVTLEQAKASVSTALRSSKQKARAT
jgi:hypothetical protein